jgi:hypothetical protein
MNSVRPQVEQALADFEIKNATTQIVNDLCYVRIHYGHTPFVEALGIAVRAFHGRLDVTLEDQTVTEPEVALMLERYLDPFIMMMLCEADPATADEWVSRFRTVDVMDVRTKCMRRAANEFDVLLKGLKLD